MIQQLIEELQELQKPQKKPTINEFFKEEFGAIPGDVVYLITMTRHTCSVIEVELVEVDVRLQRLQVFEDYVFYLGGDVVKYPSYCPGQHIGFTRIGEYTVSKCVFLNRRDAECRVNQLNVYAD